VTASRNDNEESKVRIMTTVRALPDSGEQGLELLGELRAIKGAPAGEMRIQKRVTIPGAGSFWKEFPAPLYSRQVMAELARREEGSRKNCLGVLTKGGSSPKGYVRRKLGNHVVCLPVYPREAFNLLFWKTLGYLPAGEGYLTVVKRRVGYWVWLGVAAVVTFCLAYCVFRYGAAAVVDGFIGLPRAISDGCLRMLHEWGVI